MRGACLHGWRTGKWDCKLVEPEEKRKNSPRLSWARNNMDNIMKTLWTLILIASTALMTCNSWARESTLLNDGWRFLRGEQNGAERADFIETNWQPVSLPHNWGWEQGQSGQPYYRGPGWYRRDLVIQPNSNHRYYLRFEAAGSVADVYLNGRNSGSASRGIWRVQF